MKTDHAAHSSFASSADRLRHYEATHHVRFVEREDGGWDCQECDEMAVGPFAPGMDDDATRQPVPWMLDDTIPAI